MTKLKLYLTNFHFAADAVFDIIRFLITRGIDWLFLFLSQPNT